MKEEGYSKSIEELKNLYADGFRCIKYESHEEDKLFTVYLKNFEKESSRVVRYGPDEGPIIKNYIDKNL